MKKRILAAILGVLMLSVLAVPAFAYTPAYVLAQNNDDAAVKFRLDGASDEVTVGAGVTKPANFYVDNASGSVTYADGAAHLVNAGSAIANYKPHGGTANKTLGTTQNAIFNQNDGMTIDMYAKIDNLPKITDPNAMTDTGANVASTWPNGLQFGGLVLQVFSQGGASNRSWRGNNYNDEMQAVFVKYDNETLGTDAALMLFDGNRNSTSASTTTVVTWFFELPTEYARYTIKFASSGQGTSGTHTTEFFIDGDPVEFYATGLNQGGGTSGYVYNRCATFYRTTNALANHVQIGLNGATHATTSGNAATNYCDLYLDQLDVYNMALTPAVSAYACDFEEIPYVAPTYFEVTNANWEIFEQCYLDIVNTGSDYYLDSTFFDAMEAVYDAGCELIADGTGSDEAAYQAAQADFNTLCGACNWFLNRTGWATTAGAAVTTGGSDYTVPYTGDVIPAHNPVYRTLDRIYIAFSDYDGVAAKAWTNASTITTMAGQSTANMHAFDNASTYTYKSTSWRNYAVAPVDGYPGYYQIVTKTTNGDCVVPEGGFILSFHLNGTINTNGAFKTSKYASEIFGMINQRTDTLNLFAPGSYVYLENVTMNDGAAATLDTEGDYVCYHDPDMTGTPTALERPSGANRDIFENFITRSAMVHVDALPAPAYDAVITTSAVNGTVSATVNGEPVADASSIEVSTGDAVVLTASGEGEFQFWKNAAGKVVSTENVLAFTAGTNSTSFTAVFAAAAGESTTYMVHFRDSKTGKVVDSRAFAAGTVLAASDLPTTSFIGYTFNGWKINGADAVGYEVTGNTNADSVYVKDTSSTKHTITIVNGGTSTVQRAFNEIIGVTAADANFVAWTMDGVIVSTDASYTFAAPDKDCTLEAVTSGTAPVAVAAKIDLVKDGQTFYFTMSRSAIDGYTITETGVLVTRKATASDLVVPKALNTVTQAVSSANASKDVVGFTKDCTGKTGTWLVRGYVTYTDGSTTSTVYTDVASVVID